MKKAMSLLIGCLFVLTVLYPAGVLLCIGTDYSFRLANPSTFVIATALLSVCAVAFDVICKPQSERKFISVLMAILPPLSLINSVFCGFACKGILDVVCVLVAAGCCCYLTAIHGKPFVLKVVAFALSALMVLPICGFSLLVYTFGNLSSNTVVKTVESPAGTYCAQVIDSDQGAMGGNTHVEVTEKSRLDLILFRIEKEPERVYSGEYGEYETMEIYWRDDACLVINGVEYEME